MKYTNNILNGKIDIDSFEIASTFFVSTYIQMKAITETKGIEARIAPNKELLFDNSEIATIKIAEINTLIA